MPRVQWTMLFAAIFLMIGTLVVSGMVVARDAAFVAPGATSFTGQTASDEAITIEPKKEVDLADAPAGTGRRITFFFANHTGTSIEISNISASGDSNVRSVITSDDCTREGKIDPNSRCPVEIEVTPISSGAWSVDLMMTHKGAGRFATAKIKGRTSGQSMIDKKDTGLALSTKEIKPVDFGEVEAETTKAVRSALMVNDSPEAITILSIDVIAAENGLERLDQGCSIDMELKPGESCPVTLIWRPVTKGKISTDLIIRHTGKLGFAVIPLRGSANVEGDVRIGKGDGSRSTGKDYKIKSYTGTGTPTAAEVIEKAASGNIPPLSSEALAETESTPKAPPPPPAPPPVFHLIGTVGNRAVLLKPDGLTVIADIGDSVSYGDDKAIKIMNVLPKETEIFMEGKKKILPLEAASQLTSRAAQASKSVAAEVNDKQEKTSSSSSKK